LGASHPDALLALRPRHPYALLPLGPVEADSLLALRTLYAHPLLALRTLETHPLLPLRPLHAEALLALRALGSNALLALLAFRASLLGSGRLGSLGAVFVLARLGVRRNRERKRRNGRDQKGFGHRKSRLFGFRPFWAKPPDYNMNGGPDVRRAKRFNPPETRLNARLSGFRNAIPNAPKM
jgi:hypothetical protein